MNSLPDMAEATRLTREGRLDEAVALLIGRSAAPGAPLATSINATGVPAPALLAAAPAVAGGAASANVPATASTTPKPGRLLDRLRSRLGQPLAPGMQPPDHASRSTRDGARFETRQFRNPAGSREYKLYIPRGYAGQPLPLVVMLHGCTQSPDDFAAGTRMNELAEEQPFFVLYPAQSQTANGNRCWNWFNTGDQLRDGGEPALIAGMTRAVIAEFNVAPGQVYIAGLSAGGATAAILGAAYPELYAAVGVHSGLAPGAARDMGSAFSAMRKGAPASPAESRRRPLVPTIVFHGDRDTTVHPSNGEHVIAHARVGAALASEAQSVPQSRSAPGLAATRHVHRDGDGTPVLEHWVLHGAGHAWSGGSASGSYTEPRGPDASREMLRFFLLHRAG